MILDSCFVIDLLNGVPEAVSFAKREEHEPMKVTSVNVFEVFQGVVDVKTEKKVDDFFDGLVHLDMTKMAAKRAGTIWSMLKRKGQPIDPEDCMIAGIALLEDETIVTRNTKHFSKIPGLKVVTY